MQNNYWQQLSIYNKLARQDFLKHCRETLRIEVNLKLSNNEKNLNKIDDGTIISNVCSLKNNLIFYIIQQSMNFLNSSCRNSLIHTLPTKITDRINKITQLVGRAIGQVQNDSQKSTNSTSSSSSKRKSEESSEAQSIGEILSSLQKGYLMIKHSRQSNDPHDKFVYLSQDNRYLCWKSTEKNDEKRIQITKITKIVKEGVQFCIKAYGIKDINRCIVILSTQRCLQLQASTQMDADYFKYQLQRVMKYSQAMHLNYKYCLY